MPALGHKQPFKSARADACEIWRTRTEEPGNGRSADGDEQTAAVAYDLKQQHTLHFPGRVDDLARRHDRLLIDADDAVAWQEAGAGGPAVSFHFQDDSPFGMAVNPRTRLHPPTPHPPPRRN